MQAPPTTLDGLETPAAGTRAVWVRRGFLATIWLLVILACFDLLGVQTSTERASANGYTLTLQYPHIARAGLDTVWQVRVDHPGGFDKPITLAVTGDYFDIFETQGFHPDASTSTRDGSILYLTFDPPQGDTFVVDYDAYIQPASQLGRSARISVMDAGQAAVSLDYRTWLAP